MGDMRRRVEPLDVIEQKNPLPRHQDVVEEHNAVHLLEARAQRVVEMRAAEVEAVAAQEFQPLRTARDREIDRKRAVVFAVPRGPINKIPPMLGLMSPSSKASFISC